MKRLFLGAFLMTGTLAVGPASSSALSVTPTVSHDGSAIVQRVHLQGIVPVMRFIYVTPQEKILKIVGNTEQNITPQVVNAVTYKNVPLSQSINDQYKAVLAAHGGSLKAGATYYPSAQTPQNPDRIGAGTLKMASI